MLIEQNIPNKNKVKYKRRKIEYRYRPFKQGLNENEFNEVFVLQGSCCAICKTTDPGTKGWCRDHCHDTGYVRGILCGQCNSGIGMLKDSPELLASAIEYLTKNNIMKQKILHNKWNPSPFSDSQPVFELT